jgi:hypothetical protein
MKSSVRTLRGLKEIAVFLGYSVRGVQRVKDLPTYRLIPKGMVHADITDLRDWLERKRQGTGGHR